MRKLTLKQYLEKTNTKPTKFARELGISYAYLWALCNDKAKPSNHLRKLIQLMTNNRVKI